MGNALQVRAQSLISVLELLAKPVEELVERGATELRSHRQLAANSDMVLICVTGTPEVESIVYQRDGLLEGAHDRLIVVDCSTSEPSSSARIAAALTERGASFVDAPLARTPVEAEAGHPQYHGKCRSSRLHAVPAGAGGMLREHFPHGTGRTGHKTKLVYNFITMGYAALVEVRNRLGVRGIPQCTVEVVEPGVVGADNSYLERATPFEQLMSPVLTDIEEGPDLAVFVAHHEDWLAGDVVREVVPDIGNVTYTRSSKWRLTNNTRTSRYS